MWSWNQIVLLFRLFWVEIWFFLKTPFSCERNANSFAKWLTCINMYFTLYFFRPNYWHVLYFCFISDFCCESHKHVSNCVLHLVFLELRLLVSFCVIFSFLFVKIKNLYYPAFYPSNWSTIWILYPAFFYCQCFVT